MGAEGLSLGGVLSCLGKGSRRGCGIGNGCFEPEMALEGGFRRGARDQKWLF